MNTKTEMMQDRARPDPLSLIEQDRHNSLVRFIQSLIPTMDSLGLIGPVLKASLVTTIARNYGTGKGLNYHALELAKQIAGYDDPLVVDGVEVRAWIGLNERTGRKAGSIQFLWSGDCNTPLWPGLDSSDLDDEIYFEDDELIQTLRALMKKPDPNLKDGVIENGISDKRSEVLIV